MPPEQTSTPDTTSVVDGGTPTDEEARLAAQIDTIGENPTEEPAAAGDAGDAADAATEGGAAAAAEGAAAGDDGAAGSDDGAADADAAAAAAAAAAKPAEVVTPPAAVVPPPDPIGEAPKPSMDFEAEYKKNQDAFDQGEIEGDAFQKRIREISREEAGFTARTEIYKERVQTAQQRATHEFASAAAAWEAEHKDFMANPLYADAMQQAIVAIDKRDPGLPPADLLKKAEAAAFQFTHYTPPVDTTAADDAAKKEAEKTAALAAAAKGRKPATVPATLGATPTAAHVDAAATNTAYASMDSLDIDTLENQLAKMRPDDVEKYLADAPGANATGQ